MKKPILKSKTAILNGIVALIGIIATIDPTVISNLSILIPNKEIAPHIVSIIIAIIALVNIYLRYNTKVPLKIT